MISRPTTPQLIEACCAELTGKVAPAVSDPTVKVVLDMMIAVLQGCARRSANEMAWMREEADAIEAAAERIAADVPEGQAVTAALTRYRDAKSPAFTLEDVLADYERASELLSCAVEAAYAAGHAPSIEAVQHLFEQRLANEKAVTGQFLAAGRT